MKFLLIDGNNVGVRAAFANKSLRADFTDYSKDIEPDSTIGPQSDFPTGAIHGFFRTLNAAMRDHPDMYVVVAWDGRSRSRITDSREAVAKGVVPQEYKGNRPVEGRPQQVIDFHVQRPVIMEALSKTNVPQVAKPDEDADDIIASFATVLDGHDVMVLTNDKDYYQLLAPGVTILTSDGSVLTEDWFRGAHGVSPAQWVDVGALMGDASDNIFGLPWWGQTTALKEVARHGSCEAVISSVVSSYGPLRERFPDLKGDAFDALRSLKSGGDQPKWPHVKEWMPFTGVAMAYEEGKAKLPRNAATALVYQDRVPLAKRLKTMHRHIRLPAVPVDLGRDLQGEFVAVCDRYELREVASSAGRLCARQVAS